MGRPPAGSIQRLKNDDRWPQKPVGRHFEPRSLDRWRFFQTARYLLKAKVVWIGTHTLIFIERIDGGHLIGRQFKVKNRTIFRNPAGVR